MVGAAKVRQQKTNPEKGIEGTTIKPRKSTIYEVYRGFLEGTERGLTPLLFKEEERCFLFFC